MEIKEWGLKKSSEKEIVSGVLQIFDMGED